MKKDARQLVSTLVRLGMHLLALWAVVFCVHREWTWFRGWVFVVILSAGYVYLMVWLYRNNRALLAERLKLPIQLNQMRSDVALMGLLFVVVLTWLLMVPYDALRSHLISPPPLPVAILGLILLATGMHIYMRTCIANPHLLVVLRDRIDADHAIIEERHLTQHLPEYTDYASRVRYRFCPHLW